MINKMAADGHRVEDMCGLWEIRQPCHGMQSSLFRLFSGPLLYLDRSSFRNGGSNVLQKACLPIIVLTVEFRTLKLWAVILPQLCEWRLRRKMSRSHKWSSSTETISWTAVGRSQSRKRNSIKILGTSSRKDTTPSPSSDTKEASGAECNVWQSYAITTPFSTDEGRVTEVITNEEMAIRLELFCHWPGHLMPMLVLMISVIYCTDQVSICG